MVYWQTESELKKNNRTKNKRMSDHPNKSGTE